MRDALLPTISLLDVNTPTLVAAPDGSCRLAVPAAVRSLVEKLVVDLSATHKDAAWGEGVDGRVRLRTWANDASVAWRDHLVDADAETETAPTGTCRATGPLSRTRATR